MFVSGGYSMLMFRSFALHNFWMIPTVEFVMFHLYFQINLSYSPSYNLTPPFLKFWLVSTWFFAHWRHQRAVRQLNIRRGKKLVFQLSHRQPLTSKTSTVSFIKLFIQIINYRINFFSLYTRKKIMLNKDNGSSLRKQYC